MVRPSPPGSDHLVVELGREREIGEATILESGPAGLRPTQHARGLRADPPGTASTHARGKPRLGISRMGARALPRQVTKYVVLPAWTGPRPRTHRWIS